MSNYRYDCLCVGIVVADHSCTPIPQMPAAGQLQMAKRLQLSTGGCATNVAVDLAKLGRKVGVVGRVGDDVFGEFVRDSLNQEGVDTSHLLKTPDTDTSGTLIVNVAGEDRRFVHAYGANAEFDGSELSEELLRSAPILYLGGFLLMPNLTAKRVADIFANAQALGVTTVLDVAIPETVDLWERVSQVLPYTDVFLPNSDEAELITGLADPLKQAERFCQAGAKTVVVTCGSDGAVLISDAVQFRSDVFTVPFVDGTGSGDAFDAGYIHALLDGDDAQGCLKVGSALGASCVQDTGATAGVFSQQQLADFLGKNAFQFDSLAELS